MPCMPSLFSSGFSSPQHRDMCRRSGRETNEKNHNKHDGKARAAFQQEKKGQFCMYVCRERVSTSGWEEAQKLWRHKNIKRPNTRAKASQLKGFLDFAIKVKFRTKTSMKSLINEKRTGVLWKHMNIIHNPTQATITDVQILLEPRVQTLFFF